MKNSARYAVLAAPLALALGTAAHAQEAKRPTIAAEIGLNYPTNGDVRDATQDGGIHLGVGVLLPTPGVLSREMGRTSVDLTFSRNADGGNRLNVWGLTVAERVRLSRKTTGAVPYAGLGVGVFHLQARAETVLDDDGGSNGGSNAFVATGAAEGSNGGEVVSASESKTRIGARLLLGVTLSERAYVECAYNLSGKIEDARTDGITLSIGTRF